MCKEWHDFERFFDWSMSHGYRPGLTIDRIDNAKGYNPLNCRWITRKQQAYNRTTNRYLRNPETGEVRTLEEWAKRLGVHPTSVERRIERGWNMADALTKPPTKKK